MPRKRSAKAGQMTTATIAIERYNVRDGEDDLTASRASADTNTSSPVEERPRRPPSLKLPAGHAASNADSLSNLG